MLRRSLSRYFAPTCALLLAVACEIDFDALLEDDPVIDGDAGAEQLPEFSPDLCGEASEVLCLIPRSDRGDSGVTEGGRDGGLSGADGSAGDGTETAYAWCALRCLRVCGDDTRWQCHGDPVCSMDATQRPLPCVEMPPDRDAGDDADTDADTDTDTDTDAE